VDNAATDFGAVLLIRTSQRIGPNSWVWSVSVWRVTLVNATHPASEAGTGSVAHKT